MKELYKSPVLNLLSLQPAERLANSEIDYDALTGNTGNGSVGTGGTNLGTEIDIPLP